MNPATAWRLCAIIGVPAMAVSYMIGQSAGLAACPKPGDLEPVLALEFVRDLPQFGQFLVGKCPDGQLTALARDTYGFVPLYTLFVALAAWGAGITGRRIAQAAIVTIVAAAFADLVENATLEALFEGGGGYDMLFWAVRLKFVLISVSLALIGVLLLRHIEPLRFAGYGLITAGGASILLLFTVPAAMIKTMAFGMILLLLIAITVAIRPSLAAAR
ncbi:MAG: hypothetical protein ACAH11_11910 [Sphingomonas sp.]